MAYKPFIDSTPRRPWFDSRSGHVGSVMDKVALGQDFFKNPIILRILLWFFMSLKYDIKNNQCL
jgi:hypothetical protein